LTLISGPFDVIPLVNIQILVENVSNNDEVDGPVAAFVFHLVKSINSHEVGLRIILDIVRVVLQDITQLEVLLSAD